MAALAADERRQLRAKRPRLGRMGASPEAPAVAEILHLLASYLPEFTCCAVRSCIMSCVLSQEVGDSKKASDGFYYSR